MYCFTDTKSAHDGVALCSGFALQFADPLVVTEANDISTLSKQIADFSISLAETQKEIRRLNDRLAGANLALRTRQQRALGVAEPQKEVDRLENVMEGGFKEARQVGVQFGVKLDETV